MWRSLCSPLAITRYPCQWVAGSAAITSSTSSMAAVTTHQQRSLVWHAGYEQQAEAQALRTAIPRLQQQLTQAKFHQCLGTTAQRTSVQELQSRLNAMLSEYQQITGEVYEHQDDDKVENNSNN